SWSTSYRTLKRSTVSGWSKRLPLSVGSIIWKSRLTSMNTNWAQNGPPIFAYASLAPVNAICRSSKGSVTPADAWMGCGRGWIRCPKVKSPFDPPFCKGGKRAARGDLRGSAASFVSLQYCLGQYRDNPHRSTRAFGDFHRQRDERCTSCWKLL